MPYTTVNSHSILDNIREGLDTITVMVLNSAVLSRVDLVISRSWDRAVDMAVLIMMSSHLTRTAPITPVVVLEDTRKTVVVDTEVGIHTTTVTSTKASIIHNNSTLDMLDNLTGWDTMATTSIREVHMDTVEWRIPMVACSSSREIAAINQEAESTPEVDSRMTSITKARREAVTAATTLLTTA